jgi:hypothetical protein
VGPKGLPTPETVIRSSTNTNEADAVCPYASVLVGGGGYSHDDKPLTRSYPYSTMEWTADAEGEVTAYAICMKEEPPV